MNKAKVNGLGAVVVVGETPFLCDGSFPTVTHAAGGIDCHSDWVS